MTRLLVAGIGPRPQRDRTYVFAPGLRLHTITSELIRAGNEVHLAEAFIHEREYATPATPPTGAASHIVLPQKLDEWVAALDDAIARVKPEALVVLTDGMALAAAKSTFDGPIYVDYNGHPMAERQMLGAVHNNNAALADQWLYVLPVLLRADRFATCSAAQRLALIGELGAAGRINAETCGHELVDVLRPPLPFEEEFTPTTPGFLRGAKINIDARILLFTGGYNTWLDEEMLFHAVERVLADDPKAVYVSTGGEITSHVSAVYQRFRAMVDQSPHRDRYHFIGWLEHTQYIECCLEADVGLFTDRHTLEGELGCRNRIYGYLWAGMRVVATDLAEIVRLELAPRGLVHGVPCGDVEAFAAALKQALNEGRCSGEESAARRQILREHCSPRAYYKPLVDWAANPCNAPDRNPRVQNNLADLQRDFLRFATGGNAAARELVDRLRGSRLFQLYLRQHPEVEKLLRELER